MKPDFDYSTVPYNFVHCLRTECPHAAECLRYQVALRVPGKCETINVVSPSYTPPKGKECAYFLKDCMQRFAMGIKHMLDKLPHTDAMIIKKQMINYFSRTVYYRHWRNERAFSPKEQAYIRKLFLRRGITEEPIYEEYIEQYLWEDSK